MLVGPYFGTALEGKKVAFTDHDITTKVLTVMHFQVGQVGFVTDIFSRLVLSF